MLDLSLSPELSTLWITLSHNSQAYPLPWTTPSNYPQAIFEIVVIHSCSQSYPQKWITLWQIRPNDQLTASESNPQLWNYMCVTYTQCGQVWG